MSAIGTYVGLGLMMAGALLFIAGRRKQSSVSASNSSVAVGGNNSGSINITQQPSLPAHAGGHGLTIVAIVVELIGIGVTLWHAFHLAAK